MPGQRHTLAQSTDLKPPAPSSGPVPMALPAWTATTTAERDALALEEARQHNHERELERQRRRADRIRFLAAVAVCLGACLATYFLRMG